jgi:hypothetical protein
MVPLGGDALYLAVYPALVSACSCSSSGGTRAATGGVIDR